MKRLALGGVIFDEVSGNLSRDALNVAHLKAISNNLSTPLENASVPCCGILLRKTC
jgi:hypothetical protein